MSNKMVVALGVLVTCLVLPAETLPLAACKERASAGDAEALWQLGRRYENGEGVRKDNLKALSQYRKAAEKKHAKACARLADLYETGKFVGKDAVKAARYRAMANGDSGEVAAALAQTAQERAKVDFIEVALDYIIGRNGKARDAKQGVQILYKEAKGNPTAQRVFVERWEKGDLDAGLDTIGPEEWQLVLPWFKAQYEKGRRKGGLVLGNAAYRAKRYGEAIAYWKASGVAGVARSWYLLGKFYFWEECAWSAPKSMRSDAKAKLAFERCWKMDPSWVEVRDNIGLICTIGDSECLDYPRAMTIFLQAMNECDKNKFYPYWYGIAGARNAWRKFNSRWPNEHYQYLWSRYKNGTITKSEGEKLVHFFEGYKRFKDEEKSYMLYVLKSANMGCELAKKDYGEWKKKQSENDSQ